MTKFLLLLAVVVAVIWFWRAQSRSRSGAATARPTPTNEKMVVCAHCGVRFPESEAMADTDGRLYCSDEHRQHGSR